ncbi:hypothetical protein [Oerskovia paurometabola]|uniref:Uncharacterized protein n=1 Tax=Oerskovia paurometabola TaxID=162170 RepID=A0ABW1XCY5_9CELL|nr:hypothetical protein [Oerskovia paurometabola]MBM7495526.1 hypothetical protein [Oerskovia paurometabola]
MDKVRFVGDTTLARRTAWVVTAASCVPLLIAGVATIAWRLAQVNDWQTGMRSFHAGDPFPWFWVALSVALSAWLMGSAVRAWRRVRGLVAHDRSRSSA